MDLPPVPKGVARAFTPAHVPLPLPEEHRFPISKYARLAEKLRALGWQVDNAPSAPLEDLERVHTKDYLHALKTCTLDRKAERKLGFPQSAALWQRSLHSVGGTLAAFHDALERGYGVNLAGGTHHAYPGHGEGFCVFNDYAVAIRRAFHYGLAEKFFVIDLDVHQGNGTAKIFGGDDSVFTLSVHGARNYPFQKERSNRDIPLSDGIEDEEYLELIRAELPPLMQEVGPDVMLYIGGVDVLASDRFGRMALSQEGVKQRDRFVFELCKSADVPLVYTMGGGYQKDIEVTLAGHVAGLQELREVMVDVS